jgi:MoaD family protein
MSPSAPKPTVRKVRLRYFAVLREYAGVNCENRESSAVTVEDLYDEIKEEKGFELKKDFIRFACNGDFVGSEYSLSDGDEIVFIPPVAGG